MDRIFSDARLDERGGWDSSDSSHVRKRLTSLCGEAIFLESKKMFKMRALCESLGTLRPTEGSFASEERAPKGSEGGDFLDQETTDPLFPVK